MLRDIKQNISYIFDKKNNDHNIICLFKIMLICIMMISGGLPMLCMGLVSVLFLFYPFKPLLERVMNGGFVHVAPHLVAVVETSR